MADEGSAGDSYLGRLRAWIGGAFKARRREEKRKRREARFDSSERWQRDETGFAARRYASYEEYVEHQAAKLAVVYERRKEKDEGEIVEFERRFTECAELQGKRVVLCLGARLGTEVKALHNVGFFGIGIDLNPGPQNEWVLSGDFHKLVFKDRTVDAVYTNALDHVFELARVIAEVRRVLHDDGIFVVDLLPGYEEGFTPGEYEATHWPRAEALLAEIERLGNLQRSSFRDLGQRRRDRWMQAVFTKLPDAPDTSVPHSLRAE